MKAMARHHSLPPSLPLSLLTARVLSSERSELEMAGFSSAQVSMATRSLAGNCSRWCIASICT